MKALIIPFLHPSDGRIRNIPNRYTQRELMVELEEGMLGSGLCNGWKVTDILVVPLRGCIGDI